MSRRYGDQMSSTESEKRCIFCWSPGPLTREHVISKPVGQQLIGLSGNSGLTWKDGSPQLWAGQTTASQIDDLTVRAVCADCNSTWMQQLDSRFAKALIKWTRNPGERLGRDHFQVVQRYLTKLLWVTRVGEDWTTGAWLRGERREPEFIPLSLVQDGRAIKDPTTIDSGLALQSFVGAARVASGTTELIDVPPIPAAGIEPTQKVGRVNAGLILTLRKVELRLWIVLSGLDSRWQIRWPRGVGSLSSQSRYRRLATVRHSHLHAPTLEHRRPPPVPDVEAMFTRALEAAQASLQARDHE